LILYFSLHYILIFTLEKIHKNLQLRHNYITLNGLNPSFLTQNLQFGNDYITLGDLNPPFSIVKLIQRIIKIDIFIF